VTCTGYPLSPGQRPHHDTLKRVENSVIVAKGLSEHVEQIDLGVLWSSISDPFVLQHLFRAALVVRPHSDNVDRRLVVITIEGCDGVVVGPPNDEARSGHRLAAAGLSSCAWSGEVVNSRWIESLTRVNSVHPSHRPEMFANLRHWILLFKETTAECIGTQLDIGRATSISELIDGFQSL
jgi:hypothetical protein